MKKKGVEKTEKYKFHIQNCKSFLTTNINWRLNCFLIEATPSSLFSPSLESYNDGNIQFCRIVAMENNDLRAMMICLDEEQVDRGSCTDSARYSRWNIIVRDG